MSLYPTKTRLALLQAVADGAVSRNLPAGRDVWDDIVRSPRKIKVTARMAELRRAGWVRSGPRPARLVADQPWEVTPAGQAILDGYGRLAEVTS